MNRVRFKADDIWDTPEDGNRYEVIDGELYVSPPPNLWHQRVVSQCVAIIGPFVERHGLGRVFPAPVGVVLGAESGVQPDIVFVSRERYEIFSQRGIEGAPDLVIEIQSPSTRSRDRGIKMREYAGAGVPHYWIADYDGPAVETYRLGDRGYELTGRYRPGSVLRSELFPGLEIAVDELWS